ncbi:hypothetical protein [Sphingopyxis indica]|uniref:Uncharacterized protein n=1 Tax=Sphingopyxis indica TaxID=436663 RepID=A0A239JZ50_9SPHN|nr:hypothetical protein [Sphingopyxis indica]SNT11297.1 hypothetical protein SAMN06295955_1125 [Sphingopyxis indica]
MLHLFMGKEPWFRVEDRGLGAAIPIKWQGWVLIASYLLALAGIIGLVEGTGQTPAGMAFGLALLVTAIFLIVGRKRTDGDRRWRQG